MAGGPGQAWERWRTRNQGNHRNKVQLRVQIGNQSAEVFCRKADITQGNYKAEQEGLDWTVEVGALSISQSS